jgi:hypothetical protein
MSGGLTTRERIAWRLGVPWHRAAVHPEQRDDHGPGQTSLLCQAAASTTRPSGACAEPLTAWEMELKPAVVTRWVSSSTVS